MEITSCEDSKETAVPFSSSPMGFALQPPKFNYDSAATKFYQNFVNPFHQFQTLAHINKPARRDRDPDPVSVGSETPPPPPPEPTSTTDPSPPPPPPSQVVRYRECLKNHAATLGGRVVDGCGEFMPAGEGSLKCAACECHRNFHRKEVDGETVETKTDSKSDKITTPPPPQPLPPVAEHHRFSFQSPFTAPLMQMMMAFGESSSEDLRHVFEKPKHVTNQKSSGTRKRFRTKFSEEQKEKMTEFAEKLEWKISKDDEEKVLQLCNEIGVKRQVFQVWLHNSKQAMKKKHN